MTRSVAVPIGSWLSKMTSRFFSKRFIFAIKLVKLTAFSPGLEAAFRAVIAPASHLVRLDLVVPCWRARAARRQRLQKVRAVCRAGLAVDYWPRPVDCDFLNPGPIPPWLGTDFVESAEQWERPPEFPARWFVHRAALRVWQSDRPPLVASATVPRRSTPSHVESEFAPRPWPYRPSHR